MSGARVPNPAALTRLGHAKRELFLQSNHLRTLEGLRGLEAVHGTVVLDGLPELTDLSGLEDLAQIEGDLLIGACDRNGSGVYYDRYIESSACETHNDALENVDALSGLTSLEGDLLVANNDELTSLAGLGNIDSSDSIHLRNVVVIDNAKLPDFRGLDGWNRSVDTLLIADNDALTNVEALSGLPLDRNLWVLRNHSLTTLDGFPASWNTVSGGLWIRENPALTYVRVLDGVSTLGGVGIEENERLVQISGLGATSIGSVVLIHNETLESLEGLRNLQEIGTLRVGGTSLSDLTALSALESAEFVSLTQNPLLTSLRGLAELGSVSYSLTITGNDSLPDCEAAWLCARYPAAECVTADNGGDIGTCEP